MSRYRPGDICTETADGLGYVLVLAYQRTERHSPGRLLEVYSGCHFEPGKPPSAVETFGVVVPRLPVPSGLPAN
jgi:hypothetical protein